MSERYERFLQPAEFVKVLPPEGESDPHDGETKNFAGNWDESKHPRDDNGRFVSKEDLAEAASDPAKAEELRERVTDPEQRAKLEEAIGDKGGDKPGDKGFSPNAPHGDLGRATKDGKPVSGTELVDEHRWSQDLYKGEDGEYTPERAQLHAKIIDGWFEGTEPAPEGQRVFHMMGGGPASGKSSIVKSGGTTLPERAATLDSDAAKAGLPEFHDIKEAHDHRSAAWVHEESSDIGKAAKARGLESGTNLVMDGTGDSSYEKLKASIDDARAAGYRVNADYVTIPTDEAVRRSDLRAKQNPDRGVVPEAVIRGTHRGVSAAFPRAVEEGLFDEARLWSNDVGKGEDPVLILSHDNGKTVVHDEKLWAEFKAKADE